MRVEKPWGYELIWARTDKYVGKILHINSGQSLSKQFHKVKEETIRVQKGILWLEIGDGADVKTLVLAEGEVFHVTPGLVHRMTAPINENNLSGVDIIEVSTPELDDVVRLEDDYGRA